MESALPEIQRDDELRYVTRHFTDLQGLRMAPFGAVLVVVSALEHTHAVSRRESLELSLGMLVLSFLGMQALSVAWLAFAGRWYRMHYGLVAAHREERVPFEILSILQTDQRPPENKRWPLLIYVLVIALMFVPLFQGQSLGRINGVGFLYLSFFLLPKASFASPDNPWIRGRQLLAIGGSLMIAILYVGYLIGALGFMDVHGRNRDCSALGELIRPLAAEAVAQGAPRGGSRCVKNGRRSRRA